jgi:hypothetical protein
MRKLPYILSVIPLLLFVDLAHAGDQEDAAATMDAIRAAWNTGDVDAAQKHHVAEFNMFQKDGSLLLETVDWEGYQAAFAAGLKVNVQPVHSDVRVYGDAAIMTEYQVWQFTPPQVEPQSTRQSVPLSSWLNRKVNGRSPTIMLHI